MVVSGSRPTGEFYVPHPKSPTPTESEHGERKHAARAVERLVRDARAGHWGRQAASVRGGVPLPHEWNGWDAWFVRRVQCTSAGAAGYCATGTPPGTRGAPAVTAAGSRGAAAGEDLVALRVGACLASKILQNFSRFLVTSNFGRMYKTLNINKK